jgi:DNA polymerase-4
MIVYLRLSGFYICAGPFAQVSHPVVVVKDKAVLDVDAPASERGVKPGMTLREAKAILHEGKFVEWEPDEYRDAQRRWLDVCTEFTDVVEPEEQHTAYLDLSMHPDPEDILRRLIDRVQGSGVISDFRSPISDFQSPVLSVGVARVKWLAKAALLCGDTSHLAYRYPRLFLGELPTRLLTPVAHEHRERLCFLGYKRVGEVAEIPLEVLQTQFGEEGLMIHRAAHGGAAEKVRALYPLRCASARFSFESPVESIEVLERGLSDLAQRLSAQLCANDLQGCELLVQAGFEEGPGETWERHFAKPMQSAASVLFGLKLVMDREAMDRESPDSHPGSSKASPLPASGERAQGVRGGESEATRRRIVLLRVQMPNLTRATRKQGNLYTLRSQERFAPAETAFDQMRKTFGTDAVLSAAQMPEARRRRVLKAWKDAIGWT